MNWFKRLFKKKDEDYRPRVRTLYDFLTEYAEAKHEHRQMRAFSREAMVKMDDLCTPKEPSKRLIRKNGLSYPNCNLFAWYLLEKYSEGKIKIEE